ncbi:MAG: hypothetical protein J3Q66DRAFT_419306 [Benniella sp.]|nr:MAG: hypothetical protein J3Q66DRAFT_419306 [Benniella sp.]
MDDDYHQRRFGYESKKDQTESKEHVSFWGGFYTKSENNNDPAFPAIIQKEIPSFEFNAFFQGWNAGHYVVRWRLKLLKGYHFSDGLRFRVSVNYGAEEDSTGSQDVIISHEELQKLVMNHTSDRGQGLEVVLELEELVVIQPYLEESASGEDQLTTVVVTMSSFEGAEKKYSHFQVEYVELRLFNDSNEDQTGRVPIVKGTSEPTFIMKSPPLQKADSTVPITVPITRIAWSKDNTFLATLAIQEDIGYITVWDMKDWYPSRPEATSSLVGECMRKTVMHHGADEYLEDLPIGLAISADEGAQDPPESQEGVSGPHIAVPIDPLAKTTHSNGLPTKSNKSPISLDAIQNQASLSYEEGGPPHRVLASFIGYCAFLTEGGDSSEDDSGEDANTTRSRSTLFVACNGIYIDVFKIKPGKEWRHTHSIGLTDLTPTISRRVTCQMMMDTITARSFMWLEDDGACCMVWDLQKGSNISYLSGSDDTTLGSSLFRGNSTMSISPDESMVAVASADGTLTTFYASTGIAINSKKFASFQIEYVAFIGQNNQLFVIIRDSTTFEFKSLILDPLQLSSGVKANKVPVPVIGKTILARFRDIRFKNKGLVCRAIRGEIHCYITHEPADNETIKSDNNHSRKGFHLSLKAAISGHEEKPIQGPVQTSTQEGEQGINAVKKYDVRTAVGMELSRDDDDSMCCILRVEVVEIDGQKEKVIFSFVPEPWVNISAAGNPRPKELLKAHLYGEKHFVVAGMQTLQVWSLPTNESNEINLTFIWSQPKLINGSEKPSRKKGSPGETKEKPTNEKPKDGDEKPTHERPSKKDKRAKKLDSQKASVREAIETELVGDYYHYIKQSHVHLDPGTGETEAYIELKEESGTDVVIIPSEQSDNIHPIFFNCARSIHLLAASYAYSTQKSKSSPKASDKSSFTHKEHAEAIARFTRGHINRLLPTRYLNLPQPTGDTHASSAKTPLAHDTGVHSSVRQEPLPESLAPASDLAITPYRIHTAPGGDPSTDQKSKEKLSSSPASSVLTTEQKASSAQKDSNRFCTVLTLLLEYKYLRDANHIFIEGLFTTTGHEWVPHSDVALNPIRRVIKIKNEQLLEAMIDYCIKNAKEHHPGYLLPVIQCLSRLSEKYPEITSGVFRKASYIRARNTEYVVSNAIIANLRFSDWINFKRGLTLFSDWIKRWAHLFWDWTKFKRGLSPRSPNIEDYKDPYIDQDLDFNHYEKPVFSLRSQLPFHKHVGFWRIFHFELGGRKTRFPLEKNKDQEPHRSINVYVSPFQFKPTTGISGRRKRSFLAEIAGKDFFDSPVIEASLWFRWNESGLYFWSAHFIVLLVFFILLLAITGRQIEVFKLPSDGSPPTDAQIAARYLPGWGPVFLVTIAIGLALIVYEFMQLAFSTSKYFLSPFNYVHLAAYAAPVIGCFSSMNAKPGKREDTGVDGGPSQVWVLGFAILLVYLNIIFELRIIKPLGRAVNIIVNITKKIIWFLLIFAVFLMSFTHALLYVLHTRRYKPCKAGEPDDPCKGTDYPTKYPSDFFEALSTTYFFMSGRYGPVEDSFETGTVGFRIMMVIFFFFTVILLLNVLIALMNDAFNMSETEGKRAYWKLLSEVIAEMEMISMYTERATNNDSNSEFIYYCANDEEVEKFMARSEISYLAESTQANKETQSTQRVILKDIHDQGNALKNEFESLKKQVDKLVTGY